MGIRCIGATEISYRFNLYKSIIYRTILIFLLQIEFWVGRNEQLKAQVHRGGTWEWPVRAAIERLGESQWPLSQTLRQLHMAGFLSIFRC